MQLNRYVFAVLIVSIIFFSGCANKNNSITINSQNNIKSNEYITISGIANETKDGYYIDGYVLEYNEIQKYDADDVLSQYHNKNIEVVGKGKEVNSDCEPYTQCRQGPYKAMYDIKSIKVIP